MFFRERCLGFIFKFQEVGESDKIFSIFTKEFGKIEILGRGIRKISSKLREGMELFSISQIEFVEGRKQKILVGAQIVERFKKIKKNIKKLSIVYKISQLIDCLIRGQEKDERIYRLIFQILSRLNRYSQRKEIFYYVFFFWKMVYFLGYELNFDFCFSCSKRLQEKIYLDFYNGGVVCPKCFKNVKIQREISKEIAKILKAIFREELEFVERLKIDKDKLNVLFSLSEDYFNFLCQKNERV
jgi:DNA repair protein RecO (recombination protein O)